MTDTKEEKKHIHKSSIEELYESGIFHETEVRANRLGAIVMAATCVLLAIVFILNITGVFRMSEAVVRLPLITGMIITGGVTSVCVFFRFDRWWLKYMLVIAMTFAYAFFDAAFTHKAAIIMAIPVIFSSRYFSRRITIFTAVLSTGLFLLSAVWGAVWGLFDLNLVMLEEGTRMTSQGGFLDQAVLDTGFDRKNMIGDALLFNYLSKWMIFTVIALISINIARRGRDMVLKQHEKDVEEARLESELELARKLQADMLISDFPAFPDKDSFDIYASMTPAREVGGDFYDFYMVDDSHLAVVIADVSGKGIPAALFMTSSMTLIKSCSAPGLSPGEILSRVNAQLCEKNPEGMFVTAWLGILDINSGKLLAANAGHEYPILKEPGGVFTIIKDKHGFVLGGLDSVKYESYELALQPGSVLLLYTDGLAEAENPEEEFFGLERVLETVNGLSDTRPKPVLESLKTAVEEFAAEEPQFDDLTMVCLEYSGQ